MLDWLLEFVNIYVVPFVVKAVIALVVLIVGLKLIKFFTKRLEKHKLAKKMDSNIWTLVMHTLRVVLNALIIIIAIEIVGVPSATVITIIGSCGLAFGLALQGGLSNLAGGVMLMIFKPFHAGDYIIIEQCEGIVEEIGIFYTKLVTPDNQSISIPNGLLSSHVVTNASAKENRGVDINISVAYGTNIEAAREALIRCAKNNPLVLNKPSPIVAVTGHEDSCIKLLFRAFTTWENYKQVKGELYETSLDALKEAGVEIPFPQVDVHMVDKGQQPVGCGNDGDDR